MKLYTEFSFYASGESIMNDNPKKSITIEFPDLSVKKGGYQIALNSVSYEPPRRPWNIHLHSHNSFEIHFIRTGCGIFTVDSVEYPVHGGDVVITGPEVLHAQTSGIDDPMTEFCINIGLTPMKAKPGDADDRDLHHLLEWIARHPFYIGAVNAAPEWPELLTEARCAECGWRERMVALSLSLLIRLARQAERNERTEPAPDMEITRGINRKRIIDQYLREYTKPIRADALARLLFVSRRQLSRIMKECYSMTFTEKLNRLRCEYARQLLLGTDSSVTDIASECGFSSTQYFYRVFVEMYHTSPARLRRTAQTGAAHDRPDHSDG